MGDSVGGGARGIDLSWLQIRDITDKVRIKERIGDHDASLSHVTGVFDLEGKDDRIIGSGVCVAGRFRQSDGRIQGRTRNRDGIQLRCHVVGNGLRRVDVVARIDVGLCNRIAATAAVIRRGRRKGRNCAGQAQH